MQVWPRSGRQTPLEQSPEQHSPSMLQAWPWSRVPVGQHVPSRQDQLAQSAFAVQAPPFATVAPVAQMLSMQLPETQ